MTTLTIKNIPEMLYSENAIYSKKLNVVKVLQNARRIRNNIKELYLSNVKLAKFKNEGRT